jgi:DNA-binding XRE family transcriptional regulator
MAIRLLQATAPLNAIKAARMTRGWTLDDLAAASGIDKGTLSRIENNLVDVKLETALRIAAAFGVRVEELWAWEDDAVVHERTRVTS